MKRQFTPPYENDSALPGGRGKFKRRYGFERHFIVERSCCLCGDTYLLRTERQLRLFGDPKLCGRCEASVNQEKLPFIQGVDEMKR